MTPTAIIRIVCEFYDITLADIMGDSRAPRFAVPRRVAMYLVRGVMRFSQPETGRVFGKHHTTVLCAERDITVAVTEGGEIARQVNTLRALVMRLPKLPKCCTACGRAFGKVAA